MKNDKRGVSKGSNILMVILGLVVLVAIIIGIVMGVQAIKGFFGVNPLSGFELGTYLSDSSKAGDVVEIPALNLLSYIVGEIPQALIDNTSPSGSLIVTVIIFLILAIMFADIMEAFGTFSSKQIAWFVGIGMAVIAANFKLVMIFGSVGFALVSSIGILAVILGILVPFLSYGLLHILILGKLKNWTLNRKAELKSDDSLNKFSRGIRAGKAVADSVENA